MGIFNFVRPRKAVTASRAKEATNKSYSSTDALNDMNMGHFDAQDQQKSNWSPYSKNPAPKGLPYGGTDLHVTNEEMKFRGSY
jgi:hypothetical protein